LEPLTVTSPFSFFPPLMMSLSKKIPLPILPLLAGHGWWWN